VVFLEGKENKKKKLLKKVFKYNIRLCLYAYIITFSFNNMNQEKQAQILKALGHPIRLVIMEKLLEGERCVNEIKDLFNATQPSISQHLNILKYSGIVDFRKNGNLRCYFLKEKDKIGKITQLLK